MASVLVHLRFRLPQRLPAFGASLALHMAVTAWIAFGPSPGGPLDDYRVTIVPIDQVASKRKQKIIWYSFRQKLPNVSPGRQPAGSEQPRPRIRIPERVFSMPAAQRGKQVVWLPEARIELKRDIKAPNFLAIQGENLPSPPEKVKPKQFQMPAKEPPPTPQDAPELPVAPLVSIAGVSGTATSIASLVDGNPQAPPPPRKVFVPAARAANGSGSGAGSGEALEAAPEIASGQGATLSAAVIGLNPAAVPGFTPPEASRRASIAAAPDGSGRGGSGGEKGSRRGLPAGEGPVVPGLSVKGTSGPEPTVAIASIPPRPTPPPGVFPRQPLSLNTPSVSAPMWPQSRRLEASVEGRFRDRVCYVTVATPPQGTTLAGDWTIWFGEHNAAQPLTRALMRPPVPLKSSAGRSTPDEGKGEAKVYIAGLIGQDGRLGSLTLLSGAVAHQSLLAALDGWEFTPAIRNGKAVAVDVVIEIPIALPARAKFQ